MSFADKLQKFQEEKRLEEAKQRFIQQAIASGGFSIQQAQFMWDWLAQKNHGHNQWHA